MKGATESRGQPDPWASPPRAAQPGSGEQGPRGGQEKQVKTGEWTSGTLHGRNHNASKRNTPSITLQPGRQFHEDGDSGEQQGLQATGQRTELPVKDGEEL